VDLPAGAAAGLREKLARAADEVGVDVTLRRAEPEIL
jgi:hypothetical protein